MARLDPSPLILASSESRDLQPPTPRGHRGLLRHETLQAPNRAQSGRPPAETKRRRRTKRRRTIQITPRGHRGLLRHETLQAPNRAGVHWQTRREEKGEYADKNYRKERKGRTTEMNGRREGNTKNAEQARRRRLVGAEQNGHPPAQMKRRKIIQTTSKRHRGLICHKTSQMPNKR